jgi:hypothetical protein
VRPQELENERFLIGPANPAATLNRISAQGK